MQTGGFRSPALAAIVCLLAFAPEGSRADDVAVGSLRLRGGYDANPQLLPGGRASAFAGLDAAFALGRSDDADISRTGLTGEFQRADYAARGILPSERARVALEAETDAAAGWTLKSSTSAESVRSYNLRAFDAVQSLRARRRDGPVQPFVVAELRYATLNETNAILVDFLPEDQRFVRGTLVPGLSVKTDRGEAGISVNLSATRYAQEPDLFGFRRNNERLQPYLFYRLDEDTIAFSAAVSRLYGVWHDIDFTDLRTTLFDLSLTLKGRGSPWTLDLAARREVGDTSFPISPVTVSEIYSGKLSYAPGGAWSVAALARWQRTGYRDSPFSTSVLGYGISARYDLGGGWSAGAELMRIASSALSGEPADGGVLTLSLTRRFDLSGLTAKTPPRDAAATIIKRTAAMPSSAQSGGPLKDPMPAPSISSQTVY